MAQPGDIFSPRSIPVCRCALLSLPVLVLLLLRWDELQSMHTQHAGALLCFLELRTVERQRLVSGYAVSPDVFARIFLGEPDIAMRLIASAVYTIHGRGKQVGRLYKAYELPV